MGKIIGIFIVGCVVSCYFFSFSFTFLPEALNTKLIMAVLSVPLLFLHNFSGRQLIISRSLFGAILIAALFSLTCFIAIEYNHTSDHAYTSYIFSFFTWLGGAYTTCAVIRAFHNKVTIRLITVYLAAVSVFQCLIAFIIDQVAPAQQLVDSFVSQGAQYLHQVERLYGIGASFDTAGTRFSIVLVLIASVLTRDEKVKSDRVYVWLLLLAFFTIAVLGNIISRTTSAGLILGLIIFALSPGIYRMELRKDTIRLYAILTISLIIAAAVSRYFYNTDIYFQEQLRYGFEGFFNWVETGVWRTDSTDKLDALMWVWPTDTKTWLIGSGLYGSFIYSTDIGYCRFILYCGLIGFSIFAFFFIYNPFVFSREYPKYRLMFLCLMALSFIIWLKVATDIFLIYALFYCIRESDKLSDRELNEVTT